MGEIWEENRGLLMASKKNTEIDVYLPDELEFQRKLAGEWEVKNLKKFRFETWSEFTMWVDKNIIFQTGMVDAIEFQLQNGINSLNVFILEISKQPYTITAVRKNFSKSLSIIFYQSIVSEQYEISARVKNICDQWGIKLDEDHFNRAKTAGSTSLGM